MKKETRLAYIFGNDNYKKLNKLVCAINDVDLMDAALKKCNFEIKKFKDLNYIDFRAKVAEFKFRCMEYDVGLFYYAGHGFEIGGNNYLCPIDSNDESLKSSSINISDLVKDVSKNREFISIIILDCCRDIISENTRGKMLRFNEIILLSKIVNPFF